jgi:hypothetical protein
VIGVVAFLWQVIPLSLDPDDEGIEQRQFFIAGDFSSAAPVPAIICDYNAVYVDGTLAAGWCAFRAAFCK